MPQRAAAAVATNSLRGLGKQTRQLYRSLRDGLKHRQLRCIPDRLPLAPPLVSIEDPRAERLWDAAGVAGLRHERLAENLVVQSHPAFCGLATAATVLRALAEEPEARESASSAASPTEESVLGSLDVEPFPQVWYSYWGFGFLDDVLPAAVKRSLLRKILQFDGLPLSAVAVLLQSHGLECQTVRPDGLSEFEALLAGALARRSASVAVVNFGRGVLGQRGAGHYAPVAALAPAAALENGDHAASSTCTSRNELKYALVLDSNAWRYPSAWVPVPLLWDAVLQPTPNAARRGCLLIKKQHI